MTIPFQTIDWSSIPSIEHKGERGSSFWKMLEFAGLRIRMIEYTAGYLADHWCNMGHIVYCLEGEFTSELENADSVILSAGMSYIVSDNASSHRSYSKTGAKLFIVDGDFLRN